MTPPNRKENHLLSLVRKTKHFLSYRPHNFCKLVGRVMTPPYNIVLPIAKES